MATSAIVNGLPAVKAVVVFTQSGSTAQLVAQQRPDVPVVAFTPVVDVFHRLALLWGVTPVLTDAVESMEHFEEQAQSTLITHGYARPGDLIVMTGGHPIVRRGATNFLKMVEIVEPETRTW
jgi:pyruvate kinase